MNKLAISIIFLSSFMTFYSQEDVPHCVENPDDNSCVDFKLPGVRGYLDKMCDMMWMPGCTIDNICKTKEYNDSTVSNTYCSEFSVMANICIDMTMGTGCKYFNRMCRNGTTVVKQCETPNLSHVLPTTKQTKELVNDICTDMPMDGCDRCKEGDGHCDYLEVYRDLCIQMPNMKQCAKWKSLCEVVPNWPLCINKYSPPEMRMYFHTGLKDYVLFKGWVPTTKAYYFGTWVAIFAMAIFYDVIKFVRLKLERKWAENSNYMPVNTSSSNKDAPHCPDEPSTKFRFKVELPRALLQAIEMTWGYFLMLIAMTYNVGLFAAVIAGAFVGSLIFGRYVGYQPKVSCH